MEMLVIVVDGVCRSTYNTFRVIFQTKIMIFEIAMIALVVYYFSKDPSHLKNWERQFIDEYGQRGNRTVKLNFDPNNSELMIKLCKKKVKKATLLKYPPIIETHFLAFKKYKHPYFRARMIRCTEKFAIIRAPGRHCAYILQKGKRNKDLKGLMFYIHGKFCYNPHKLKNLTRGEHERAAYDYDNRDPYYGTEYTTHLPYHAQYGEHEYQPCYQNSSQEHRQCTSNTYHGYDTHKPFYHPRELRRESVHYSRPSQFQPNKYLPRADEYGKREYAYALSNTPPGLNANLQDFRKQTGKYMNNSSKGNELQSQERDNFIKYLETKPTYKAEDYLYAHRPNHEENYSNVHKNKNQSMSYYPPQNNIGTKNQSSGNFNNSSHNKQDKNWSNVVGKSKMEVDSQGKDKNYSRTGMRTYYGEPQPPSYYPPHSQPPSHYPPHNKQPSSNNRKHTGNGVLYEREHKQPSKLNSNDQQYIPLDNEHGVRSFLSPRKPDYQVVNLPHEIKNHLQNENNFSGHDLKNNNRHDYYTDYRSQPLVRNEKESSYKRQGKYMPLNASVHHNPYQESYWHSYHSNENFSTMANPPTAYNDGHSNKNYSTTVNPPTGYNNGQSNNYSTMANPPTSYNDGHSNKNYSTMVNPPTDYNNGQSNNYSTIAYPPTAYNNGSYHHRETQEAIYSGETMQPVFNVSSDKNVVPPHTSQHISQNNLEPPHNLEHSSNKTNPSTMDKNGCDVFGKEQISHNSVLENQASAENTVKLHQDQSQYDSKIKENNGSSCDMCGDALCNPLPENENVLQSHINDLEQVKTSACHLCGNNEIQSSHDKFYMNQLPKGDDTHLEKNPFKKINSPIGKEPANEQAKVRPSQPRDPKITNIENYHYRNRSTKILGNRVQQEPHMLQGHENSQSKEQKERKGNIKYPIYREKSTKQAHVDKEWGPLYYTGKIYTSDEEPHASLDNLEKLPSSYFISSHSKQQSSTKNEEYKQPKMNPSKDKDLFISRSKREEGTKPALQKKPTALNQKVSKEHRMNKNLLLFREDDSSASDADQETKIELNPRSQTTQRYSSSQGEPSRFNKTLDIQPSVKQQEDLNEEDMNVSFNTKSSPQKQQYESLNTHNPTLLRSPKSRKSISPKYSQPHRIIHDSTQEDLQPEENTDDHLSRSEEESIYAEPQKPSRHHTKYVPDKTQKEESVRYERSFVSKMNNNKEIELLSESKHRSRNDQHDLSGEEKSELNFTMKLPSSYFISLESLHRASKNEVEANGAELQETDSPKYVNKLKKDKETEPLFQTKETSLNKKTGEKQELNEDLSFYNDDHSSTSRVDEEGK